MFVHSLVLSLIPSVVAAPGPGWEDVVQARMKAAVSAGKYHMVCGPGGVTGGQSMESNTLDCKEGFLK